MHCTVAPLEPLDELVSAVLTRTLLTSAQRSQSYIFFEANERPGTLIIHNCVASSWSPMELLVPRLGVYSAYTEGLE